MTTKLRTNIDIAQRVRELAMKREREAARASRKIRQQLNAIASNYRALAEELERTVKVAESEAPARKRRPVAPRR
ncbi:MAG TPA: hypothetical protein VNR11_21415 [Xanthobacteraceae bacterium]|nr:hypothetical protein [Xanthobacteraceae bacterium]